MAALLTTLLTGLVTSGAVRNLTVVGQADAANGTMFWRPGIVVLCAWGAPALGLGSQPHSSPLALV